MCWESNKLPVKRIAKEGIYTYKVVYDYSEFLCDSLIMGFVYEYYKLYTQNKAIMPLCGVRTNKWIIEEGFHSYRTWLTAKKAFEGFSTDPSIRKRIKIVQCIIPKGTTFYINEKNEIVSNGIIITNSTKVLPPQKPSYPQKKIGFLVLLLTIIRGIIICFALFQLFKLIWYVLDK